MNEMGPTKKHTRNRATGHNSALVMHKLGYLVNQRERREGEERKRGTKFIITGCRVDVPLYFLFRGLRQFRFTSYCELK